MTWISAVAVLGAGLLACGSDGEEGPEPFAGSEAAEEGSGAEEVDRDAPPVGVDADAGCPSADEVGARAGQPIEVWDLDIGEDDGTFVAACTYRSDDFELQFQVLCVQEDDVEAARSAMAVTAGIGPTSPYPVGDEGLIQDDHFIASDTGQPVASERARVRWGDVICDGDYTVVDPPGGEVAPEVRATLEFLMTTITG